MATAKKVSAIKNTPKHLLGIQNLSVLEAKEILTEAKSFIWQVWNNDTETCSGETVRLSQDEISIAVQQAKQQLGGQWRLPTKDELESLISMIQQKNQEINLISREIFQKRSIRERHILDSAQIIDFVDLNTNTTCDLGTGGGMPGLIIAIVMKKLKNDMKITLYEKSYHKCAFLKEVSKKLNLNTDVIQKDIFTVKNIETGTIMSRAFKPMPIILDLVNQNFRKYKNIILFMGKTGRKILNDTLKEWDLEYEEKKSLTNVDSFILNIKEIKKKFL